MVMVLKGFASCLNGKNTVKSKSHYQSRMVRRWINEKFYFVKDIKTIDC